MTKFHQTELFKEFMLTPVMSIIKKTGEDYGWGNVIVTVIATILTAGILWNMNQLLNTQRTMHTEMREDAKDVSKNQEKIMESFIAFSAESKADRIMLHNQVDKLGKQVEDACKQVRK